MKKLFTFLAAILFASTSFAQIPNAGFETWQTKIGVGFTGPYTYEIPQKWQLGIISEMLATFGMKPNVGKSTVAQSGSFALKLSANADSIGSDLTSTFALGPNVQPHALTGYFRTSGVVTNPTDFGQAFVFLTKWNGTSRDTIGFGAAELDSSPSLFKTFTAPVTYTSSANPDTAIAYFLYFPQAANTHIMIDNLSFLLTLGTPEPEKALAQFKFFPNPVTSNATLTFNAPKAANTTLKITDVTGKEVKTMALGNLNAGANTVEVPLEELKKGMYFATLQTASGTQTMRFVKQ